MKTVSPSSPKCEQKTRSGNQCRAYAVNGSALCFAHDPALAAKRTGARQRGGQHGQRAVLTADTPEVALRSAADVADFAVTMINHIVRGRIDPKVANAAGCWLNIYLRTRELDVLECRITALEAAQTGAQGWCEHLEGAEQLLGQEVTA